MTVFSRKTCKFYQKKFRKLYDLRLASGRLRCHIAATRHCGFPLYDAVALPGRFLPELGRSLGSGLFLLLEIARERAQMIGRFDGGF
jgi:hypothetical protein